jgi:hypothetical protein
MQKKGFIYKVWDLYYDGFRHMKLGKTLWLIIVIKLFIIFIVLKIFFFPNFLNTKVSDNDKANYVSNQIINRIEP